MHLHFSWPTHSEETNSHLSDPEDLIWTVYHRLVRLEQYSTASNVSLRVSPDPITIAKIEKYGHERSVLVPNSIVVKKLATCHENKFFGHHIQKKGQHRMICTSVRIPSCLQECFRKDAIKICTLYTANIQEILNKWIQLIQKANRHT